MHGGKGIEEVNETFIDYVGINPILDRVFRDGLNQSAGAGNMLACLEVAGLDQIGKSGDYMLGDAYDLGPLLLERGLNVLRL